MSFVCPNSHDLPFRQTSNRTRQRRIIGYVLGVVIARNRRLPSPRFALKVAVFNVELDECETRCENDLSTVDRRLCFDSLRVTAPFSSDSSARDCEHGRQRIHKLVTNAVCDRRVTSAAARRTLLTGA